VPPWRPRAARCVISRHSSVLKTSWSSARPPPEPGPSEDPQSLNDGKESDPSPCGPVAVRTGSPRRVRVSRLVLRAAGGEQSVYGV
ncbi:hypothetical protein CHARACLAT_007364, partial [Characodon lateralis]|nr:hypothetical protein [Characodon lateralis]